MPLALAFLALTYGGLAYVAVKPGGADASSKRLKPVIGLSALISAATVVSPLDRWGGEGWLTGYVCELVLLIGVAAPMLAFADSRLNSRSRRWWSHPVLALVVMNVGFFISISPAVHNASISNHVAYALTLVLMLMAATCFWRPVVEPYGNSGALPPSMRLGYLLIATVPQTFAGITIALAHRVAYVHLAGSSLPTDALNDQQIAGSVVALASKIALFIAFGVVLAHILRDDPDDSSGGDDDSRPVTDPQTDPNCGVPTWIVTLDSLPTATENDPAPRRSPIPARH